MTLGAICYALPCGHGGPNSFMIAVLRRVSSLLSCCQWLWDMNLAPRTVMRSSLAAATSNGSAEHVNPMIA